MNNDGNVQKIILNEADLKRAIITFLIILPLVFLFDAFIVHSIPAPEGTFSIHAESGTISKFNLFESSQFYSDAKCIDSDLTDSVYQTYLVEKDGQAHLLLYEFHFISRRGKLVEDIPIDPYLSKTYRINAFLCFYNVTVSEGKLVGTESVGLIKGGLTIESPEIACYFLLSFVISLVVYRISSKYKRKTR
jgi:hypothetical protein